ILRDLAAFAVVSPSLLRLDSESTFYAGCRLPRRVRPVSGSLSPALSNCPFIRIHNPIQVQRLSSRMSGDTPLLNPVEPACPLIDGPARSHERLRAGKQSFTWPR